MSNPGLSTASSALRKRTSILSALVHPAERFSGVRPLHVYALRLGYMLMFFVLGHQTWTHILHHRGPWESDDAMAWCIWTAFATLAGPAILCPLSMLPILLLEVFYKTLWLILVAYPLWVRGELAGSAEEPMAIAFIWVLLPIVAIPWDYALAQFVLIPLKRRARAWNVKPPLGAAPSKGKL